MNEKASSLIKALCSQFLINLMYKSTAGISLLKKKQVQDELRMFLIGTERKIEESKVDKENWKKVFENTRIVLNVLGVDWQE